MIFKSSLMSDCSLVGCDSAAVVYHALQRPQFRSMCDTVNLFVTYANVSSAPQLCCQ